jgi:hypothetical protein
MGILGALEGSMEEGSGGCEEAATAVVGHPVWDWLWGPSNVIGGSFHRAGVSGSGYCGAEFLALCCVAQKNTEAGALVSSADGLDDCLAWCGARVDSVDVSGFAGAGGWRCLCIGCLLDAGGRGWGGSVCGRKKKGCEATGSLREWGNRKNNRNSRSRFPSGMTTKGHRQPQEQRQPQIPFGDDNQKGNDLAAG